ncbi:PREDICTED: protein O-linked-mannose beta-1,4-N-acetylglucosaminyltransferase 2-like [Nelumbo nucifera]|nr:PREDICTED: protein O-linked-mannose beta-1,4-N-acetylglucosaminyltransferase 2-like [Nelumbo nucifera]
MKQVTPVEIRTPNSYSPPRCDITHEVPAAIFSSGGLTGNLFHEFNEIIIPLFITCRHFRSRIRFIITDFKPWWVRKFGPYLSKLSRYGIINSGKDDRVHCFPGAVIGLKYHDNLSCNTSSIPGGYSMLDFKRFLRESFNLKTKHEFEIEKLNLIIISRRNSMKFLNEGDMVRVAKELGFRVTVISPGRKSNLQKMSELVNSCSVLVGAHGTGLTNAVFLPAGAVLVQVVPWGLDRPSNAHFGGPVRQMGLHYIEYRISPDESTLVEIYGRDHPVITDSASLYGQDLRLKIDRFKETLEHALYLLGRLSPN